MRILQFFIRSMHPMLPAMISLTLFCGLQSCKTETKEKNTEAEKEEQRQLVEITTVNMDFRMADTIPAGWNNFLYKNQSPQTHFILIDKYPEGKNSEDAEKYVAPVFDKAMKLINEGKTEEGYAEFGNLPEWFGEVVFMGGTGLLSPGETGETTLYLEPGKYMIECYVKMENGIFHTSMGMTKDIVVSTANSGVKEPEADISIELSEAEGMVFNDTIRAGKNVFSVFYKDQKVHENFVGHDVNLVRLGQDADLNLLEKWMNWADPKGLIEPAPSNVTFMGGVNDMPAGSKGYFTADLAPGNYVLISEVPNASGKNLMKTFVISE